MNIIKFLLTNQKNSDGKKGIYPPIGDLCVMSIGILWYLFVNDWTGQFGLLVLALGITTFCIAIIHHKKPLVGNDSQ